MKFLNVEQLSPTQDFLDTMYKEKQWGHGMLNNHGCGYGHLFEYMQKFREGHTKN